MKSKVTLEVATAAYEKWLDAKRIKQKKRESNKDSGEVLIDAFMDGSLTLNETTNELTLDLVFPIGKDDAIKTLTFKPRLAVGETHKYMKGLKAGDTQGTILAYITALTGENSEVIKKLDTEDYSAASSIAVFFF